MERPIYYSVGLFPRPGLARRGQPRPVPCCGPGRRNPSSLKFQPCSPNGVLLLSIPGSTLLSQSSPLAPSYPCPVVSVTLLPCRSRDTLWLLSQFPSYSPLKNIYQYYECVALHVSLSGASKLCVGAPKIQQGIPVLQVEKVNLASLFVKFSIHHLSNCTCIMLLLKTTLPKNIVANNTSDFQLRKLLMRVFGNIYIYICYIC